MRIFLLPLTTRQALVYCQKIAPNPNAQRSIYDRVSTKAVETWANWEKAEKGWKKQVVTYGNKALMRIPYQEWGLKSFPTSNPDLQAEQVTNGTKFDVIYPANVMNAEDVPKVLARLARERKTFHYNRYIGSLIAIPFTIPFALIPVIPNLPFFYVAYRAWSHRKALKGSDHLDFILDHRLFRPLSTGAVERLYERFTAGQSHRFEFLTRSQLEQGEGKTERLIMPAGAHNEAANELEVPELSGEIERAVWQVEQNFKAQEQAQAQAARQSATTQQQPADVKNEKKE